MLQRRISDAIHDYNANKERYDCFDITKVMDRRKSKNRRSRDPTRPVDSFFDERDMMYGPQNPLKARYRDMNTEAVQLFIQQRSNE